jgi:hypothetical protein
MIVAPPLHGALRDFAAAVTAKANQTVRGEPEDQLRGPFEQLMEASGRAMGWTVVCTGETALPGRMGRVDYAVHRDLLLAGHVELKAPGAGAQAARFKGHNRDQFKRFSWLLNVLYTDGNEWALYRSGEMVGRPVRLKGDVVTDGKHAVAFDDAHAIERLVREFLTWNPVIPTDRQGRIDLRGLAGLLAPLCRSLRRDVTEALDDPGSPLVELAKDWRHLLFPEATPGEFADAYAQTVTFALLLGRSEGAEPLTLAGAQEALAAKHSLLSRALTVLTDPATRADMAASLDSLLRVVAAVPLATLARPEDPWLYFYEHFLAVYDKDLRRDAGAYYTPVEVVHAQVRLIDDLLVKCLSRPLGFAEPGVVTIDPAVGTGTYLLGVIEHALTRVEAQQGPGALAGQATTLAGNLYGFEQMVGPYAVSELRVSRALQDRGASLPAEGPHVYLTDTLESPHAAPRQTPLYLRPIADQHTRALQVKRSVPVIVCLGNPPYDRHKAATDTNRARTGSWVRWGEGDPQKAIFNNFVAPARKAGHGRDLKNLYNLYVYFWRWALWKVFEHETSQGPGIVSFISAASYLDGDAFCGMREHLRRQCDEIWILDLGGEGRGTRRSDNVFAIQTPVAIALALRRAEVRPQEPAHVHYARLEGTRTEKLAALDALRAVADLPWQVCPSDWQAPFRPAGRGTYFAWPLLKDLMPWQHSGCEFKRTWPISHDPDTLVARWRRLLDARGEPDKQQEKLFVATRDRGLDTHCATLDEGHVLTPIGLLARDAPAPPTERYAFRSLDRQWALADPRLGDYLRPDLRRAHGPQQVYLTSLFNHPLGDGPAVMACAHVPDRHHLRGNYGGKDVMPLFRDARGAEANVAPGLLDALGRVYGRPVTPQDFIAYVYGVLGQPAFTARYARELETRELRVPLTKGAALFERLRTSGARLLHLHTYGERFAPPGAPASGVTPGAARCARAVPGHADGYPASFAYDDGTLTLHVGDGRFAPVAPAAYEFEVSGLKVVQSWLKYRMRDGAGRQSSRLDKEVRPRVWTSQMTTELLELLWVLEASLAGYHEQAQLLEAVASGDCIAAHELPAPPESLRQPPRARGANGEMFGAE